MYSRLRTWWAWRQQGCPRDFPVVIRPGRLIADRHGQGTIDDFWLCDLYLDPHVTLDVGDLWDRLSAMYPVERESADFSWGLH